MSVFRSVGVSVSMFRPVEVSTWEKFGKIVNENGIILEFAAVGTPQQYGKAERDNRLIVDHARSILMGSSLSGMAIWFQVLYFNILGPR